MQSIVLVDPRRNYALIPFPQHLAIFEVLLITDGTLDALMEVMKAEFTEWRGRIAPLFDVAQTVLMVKTEMSYGFREREEKGKTVSM